MKPFLYINICCLLFIIQPQCSATFPFHKQPALLCLLTQPLDYESQNEHVLVLTVENVNRLSNKAPNFPVSSATVVVIVMNENEAPLFREDPIKIVVPESVVPGTLLKSNIAFDPDHSDLRYDAAPKQEELFCAFTNLTKVILQLMCL